MKDCFFRALTFEQTAWDVFVCHALGSHSTLALGNVLCIALYPTAPSSECAAFPKSAFSDAPRLDIDYVQMATNHIGSLVLPLSVIMSLLER